MTDPDLAPDDLSALTQPDSVVMFVSGAPDPAVVAYIDQMITQLVELQGRLTYLMLSVYGPEVAVRDNSDLDEVARRETIGAECSELVFNLDQQETVLFINLLLNKIASFVYEAVRGGWRDENVRPHIARLAGVSLEELTEVVDRWKQQRAVQRDRQDAAPDHLDPG